MYAIRSYYDQKCRDEEVPDLLAHYRRYSDRRFYKGVENVDLLEALAQRRCASGFASYNFV